MRNISKKQEEKRSKKIAKNAKGITLVALVITIIIIIILATVTINMAFGDDGIIKRAELAKDMYANDTAYTDQSMANATAYLDEMLNGVEGGTEPEDQPEEPVEPENPSIDETLPDKPNVVAGIIPVKYESGTGWVRTTEDDPEWYNYGTEEVAGGAAGKTWANAVLGNASWTTSGEKQVLNESATYSMVVWIPRYAYQITSQYHQNGSGAGNINIAFINTANEDKEGKTYSETYPSANTGSGMTEYVVHPAFNYGGTRLAGFWAGKFETSNTAGSSTDSTSQTVQIKGNVSSWRSIQVKNIFTVCTNMNASGNVYGLSEDDNVIDPHMMKNSEWGAVAYLSQSKYGKNAEVTINSNSSYTTGGGNYVSNTAQSTNGNITGIYDMSGGAWEYVAGYVGSGSSYGTTLVSAAEKYKDVYPTSYTSSTPANGHYGDAVYETSSSSSGTNSWYSDYSSFPNTSRPFFVRGGYYGDGSYAGVFFFNGNNGDEVSSYSFRVVLSPLSVT